MYADISERTDEQNQDVVPVDVSVNLVTKATFLHNTKGPSSKTGEYKDREKHKKGLKEYV